MACDLRDSMYTVKLQSLSLAKTGQDEGQPTWDLLARCVCVVVVVNKRRVEGENLRDGYLGILGSILSASGLFLLFPPTIQCVFSQNVWGQRTGEYIGDCSLESEVNGTPLSPV